MPTPSNASAPLDPMEEALRAFHAEQGTENKDDKKGVTPVPQPATVTRGIQGNLPPVPTRTDSSADAGSGAQSSGGSGAIATTPDVAAPANGGTVPAGDKVGLVTLVLRSKEGLPKAGMPRDLAEPISRVMNEIFDQTRIDLADERDLFERLLATSEALHLLVARRSKHDLVLGQNTLTREDLQQLGATYFYASVARQDAILSSDMILLQTNRSRTGVDAEDLLNKFVGAYKELMAEHGAPLRTLLKQEFDDTNKTGATAFLAGMLAPLFYVSHLVPEKPKSSGGILGWFTGPAKPEEPVPNHLKDLQVLEPLVIRDVRLIEDIFKTPEKPKPRAPVRTEPTVPVLPPIPQGPVVVTAPVSRPEQKQPVKPVDRPAVNPADKPGTPVVPPVLKPVEQKQPTVPPKPLGPAIVVGDKDKLPQPGKDGPTTTTPVGPALNTSGGTTPVSGADTTKAPAPGSGKPTPTSPTGPALKLDGDKKEEAKPQDTKQPPKPTPRPGPVAPTGPALKLGEQQKEEPQPQKPTVPPPALKLGDGSTAETHTEGETSAEAGGKEEKKKPGPTGSALKLPPQT